MAKVINLARPVAADNPLRHVDYSQSTIDPSLGTVNTNILETVIDGTHSLTDGRGLPDTGIHWDSNVPLNVVTNDGENVTHQGAYVTHG